MKKLIALLFTAYCLFGNQTVLAADGPEYVCRCSAKETITKGDGTLQEITLENIVFKSEEIEHQNILGCVEKFRVENPKANNIFCSYEPQLQMTELSDEFKLQAPKLQVRIPGFDKFSEPPTQWDQEGNVYLPWLGEYIRAIYNFGLVAISILAVLMIIVSGIKVLTSGLGGEKKEAYTRIAQAVIGLVLAWGSYTILFIINPNLLNLKSLSVRLVQPVDIPDDIMTEIPQGFPAEAPPNDLVALDGYTKFFVTNATNEAFKKVKDEIENIGVNSAYRSAGEQYSLMISMCGCPKTPPQNAVKSDWENLCTNYKTCNAAMVVEIKNGIMIVPKVSHFSGQAIDAQISEKPTTFLCKDTSDEHIASSEGVAKFYRSGNLINTGYCISKDQQFLIKAMLNNGFCVLLGDSKNIREPWHFQYQLFNNNCVGKEHENLKKLYYVQNEE